MSGTDDEVFPVYESIVPEDFGLQDFPNLNFSGRLRRLIIGNHCNYVSELEDRTLPFNYGNSLTSM